MAIDGKIGGAHFELSVSSAKFAEGLNAAKSSAASASTQISGSMQAAGNAAEAAGDRFKTTGERITEATGPFKDAAQVLGRITGIIGLATLALTPFIRAFQEVSREAAEAAAATAKVGKELNELASTRDIKSRYGDTPEALFQLETQAAKRAYDNRVNELQKAKVREKEIYDKAFAEYEAQFEEAKRRQQQRENAEANRQREREADRVRAAKEADDEIARQRAKEEETGAELYRDNIDDFIRTIQQLEKEQIASRKRVADAALKAEMDNIRRLEDYRRSITQGFGVGDVASSDLSALVDAMKQVTANQISSRD